MKIAVLSVAPTGKEDYHPELKKLPYYFVTHDERHPDAVAFREGKN